MEQACEISMTRVGRRFPKRAAYWRIDEIAELRKICLKSRRKYARSRQTTVATMESEALKKERNS